MARNRSPRQPDQRDILRALAADEIGATAKPFGSVWPIAFCYPNTYHVGMSALGFQTLISRVNEHPDAAVERFFWNVSHPDALGGRHRRPHLASSDLDNAGEDLADATPAHWPTDPPLSVENQRRLDECPIVCFSIPFEMDDLHIIDMLERSNIRAWAALRGPNDPLIVIGGATVTMNRLPLYDFADVIVHGDGESAMDRLVEVLEETGPGRAGLREALRHEPGFEITNPRHPDDQDFDPAPPVPVSRLSLADRLADIPTYTRILTPHTEFSNRGLVELSRGCPYKCNFCIMGYQPYNYKWRSPEDIERQARTFLPHTKRIGLVASAVGIHKQIEEITERLMRLEMEISFSSLRVEDVKPVMIDALLASGQKTLTIAPEAGNDRLRIQMRKRLHNDRIAQFAHETIARGMRNLKLYFMVGVMNETDDDVVSIAELTERLHGEQVSAARAHGHLGHLALNVGVFVPKPGTPQRAGGFVGVGEARRRLKLLRKGLKRIPNLKVHFSNPHLAAAQTILSCGDRRAADFLWWAWRHAKGDWPRATREFEGLLEEFGAPLPVGADPSGAMGARDLLAVEA
ncbi:MAG: radical SAM protein [Sumerlaeia bacterium]